MLLPSSGGPRHSWACGCVPAVFASLLRGPLSVSLSFSVSLEDASLDSEPTLIQDALTVRSLTELYLQRLFFPPEFTLSDSKWARLLGCHHSTSYKRFK